MTYIGIYSSEKGLAAITDSQATAGDQKDDRCQKLYTIGGNIYTGTGLAIAIKDTAKKLESIVDDDIVDPQELARLALREGMQTFDFSHGWAKTHLHISGPEKGLGNRGNFRIYAVVLSGSPGIYDVGMLVFDGSGSASVVQALERDIQNGLSIMIYKELDTMLAFLYDTGIEAPESPGVNMLFQFGFTDGLNVAAVYHPDIVIDSPPRKLVRKKLRESFSKKANDSIFEELHNMLRERYVLRRKYTEACDAVVYGRRGCRVEKVVGMKDALREKTIGLMSRMLDTKPRLISQKKPHEADAAQFVRQNHSGTLYCYKSA